LNNRKSFILTWNILIPEILNRGLNINQTQSQGAFGRSLLHLAVFLKEKEITAYLLNHGADINSIDTNGNSIISTAVIRYDGDGYFIELLINRGADVYLKNNYEVSAIGLARSIANNDVSKYFELFENE
jgi:ankyrin repeat protein